MICLDDEAIRKSLGERSVRWSVYLTEYMNNYLNPKLVFLPHVMGLLLFWSFCGFIACKLITSYDILRYVILIFTVCAIVSVYIRMMIAHRSYKSITICLNIMEQLNTFEHVDDLLAFVTPHLGRLKCCSWLYNEIMRCKNEVYVFNELSDSEVTNIKFERLNEMHNDYRVLFECKSSDGYLSEPTLDNCKVVVFNDSDYSSTLSFDSQDNTTLFLQESEAEKYGIRV